MPDEQPSAMRERFCAKCRDSHKWSPAEDVNGDGKMWHWSLWGLSADDIANGYTTALAEKCMAKGSHGKVRAVGQGPIPSSQVTKKER